jgi:exonuclease III
VRAAVRQRSPDNLGLLSWLDQTAADVVCLQETRADDEQVADALAPALADGWKLASAEPHLSHTSVFDGQRDAAEQRIAEIIAANRGKVSAIPSRP